MTRSFTRTGSWRRSLRNGFRSERQCASVWKTVKIQANVVCERMAKNSGGNRLQLHAPIVLDSYEAKEMLLKQHFIKSVMEKARNAELAVVGLGSSPQYFELTESYLHGINREKDDISRRLVGDISYNYFDKEGELIDCKWNRQLISLNIEEIKRIPPES